MIKTLPGFREFYPESCATRNAIFGVWRDVASSFSFLEYDTPILEPLELFTEKSGQEIVDQLFNFEDRGGRAVALRPESTPSLARFVGSKANSLKRPIKWFTIGEQFRFERPQKGRLRSFYQYNIDIFGEASYTADAEVIGVLIQTIKAFKLTSKDVQVRLSDRNLWVYFLNMYGIKDEDAPVVLNIIDKIEREDLDKIKEKLLPYLNDKLDGFIKEILSFIKLRSISEMRNFITSLETKDNSAEEKMKQRLEDWDNLIGTLEAMGIYDFITIDLGIVRGLAYYTGFVFEAFEVSGQSRALAGGGRYDTLVEKLTGTELPAVGFAMGDVVLGDVLAEKDLLNVDLPIPDFFVVAQPECKKASLRDITLLRENGYKVEYLLKDFNFNKQFKTAAQSMAKYTLIYESDSVVKVRDMSNREETELSRDNLLENIKSYLSINAK